MGEGISELLFGWISLLSEWLIKCIVDWDLITQLSNLINR
jgi:hypothetical protein